jgi:hypothetical protein
MIVHGPDQELRARPKTTPLKRKVSPHPSGARAVFQNRTAPFQFLEFDEFFAD